MATHSSILAWEIPQAEEAGGLQSMWLQEVGHNLATEHDDIMWSIISRVLLHTLAQASKEGGSLTGLILGTREVDVWRN